MSICESGKIAETLDLHDTETFLYSFRILPIPDAALSMAVVFMSPPVVGLGNKLKSKIRSES